jgi:hypothetical protein
VFVLVVLATAAAAEPPAAPVVHRGASQDVSPRSTPARPSAQVCDLVFALAWIGAALAIGGQHPEFAMLFVGVSTAMLVATFVIEPATAVAVSGPGRRG